MLKNSNLSGSKQSKLEQSLCGVEREKWKNKTMKLTFGFLAGFVGTEEYLLTRSNKNLSILNFTCAIYINHAKLAPSILMKFKLIWKNAITPLSKIRNAIDKWPTKNHQNFFEIFVFICCSFLHRSCFEMISILRRCNQPWRSKLGSP